MGDFHWIIRFFLYFIRKISIATFINFILNTIALHHRKPKHLSAGLDTKKLKIFSLSYMLIYQGNLSFLSKKACCGFSLVVSHCDTSNENHYMLFHLKKISYCQFHPHRRPSNRSKVKSYKTYKERVHVLL